VKSAILACLFVCMIGVLAQGTKPQTIAPKEVMAKMVAKSKATASYSYQWDYRERDEKSGKMNDKETYKLEFLKPNYRKMTIVERDFFSNGAVLIYNPDEDSMVNARKGIIRRSYKTDDSEIDGYFRTDFGSITAELQDLFKGSKGQTVKQESLDGRQVWHLTFSPQGKKYTKVDIWLDTTDDMLRKIEFHDAKGLYSSRHFKSYAFKQYTKNDFKF
jgi:outer membrane lipoprotein-sorting protein